jgi:histidine phosphotransferase ChpT
MVNDLISEVTSINNVNDFELIGYITSRFFHDLSGPIGAIHNGSEFLREDKAEMRNRAINLIEMSSKEAITRLQYFKKAFGYVQPGNNDLERVKQLLEEFFSAGKVKVEWHHKDDLVMSNYATKLLFNIILVVNSVMIYGGKLDITLVNENNDIKIEVKGSGISIKYDNDISEIIMQRNNDITLSTNNAILFYLSRLLTVLESSFKLEHTDNSFSFNAVTAN